METKTSLLKEKTVADMLNISLSTLQHWRNEKKGPPYLKLGVNVRYSQDDVEAYLKKRIVNTDGDAA